MEYSKENLLRCLRWAANAAEQRGEQYVVVGPHRSGRLQVEYDSPGEWKATSFADYRRMYDEAVLVVTVRRSISLVLRHTAAVLPAVELCQVLSEFRGEQARRTGTIEKVTTVAEARQCASEYAQAQLRSARLDHKAPDLACSYSASMTMEEARRVFDADLARRTAEDDERWLASFVNTTAPTRGIPTKRIYRSGQLIGVAFADGHVEHRNQPTSPPELHAQVKLLDDAKCRVITPLTNAVTEPKEELWWQRADREAAEQRSAAVRAHRELRHLITGSED